MSPGNYRAEHRWGAQEGCSLHSGPPVRPQGAGLPRPSALSPQSRQAGPGGAQAPRKVAARRGQPYPRTPHEYHFLCVGCRGVALADALGMVAELAR